MQNKKGFSLFELMIVIGIIAILSAITVPNLIGWYHNQGLRSAVVELQSNLQLAKMFAVKQNQSCSININTGAGSYNIPDIGKTVLLGTYSGGVVFDSPDGTNTADLITFSSRGICASSLGGVPLTIGNVCLTNRDQSAFYRTRVFISGGVVTSKWNGSNWE
ncbi:MAG: prepilin-type N-terminal cleavage/methylation domain-containing protein [Proteobacteria bacterium]|nr:prepilin-type N-terminal cleavage/methylation domain-containing protein [Pseudomonadota bacterium]